MSGVGQAVFMNQRSFVTAPEIGSAYEGGFFAGSISTTGNGVATHYLIVAPKSSGEDSSKQWKTTNTADYINSVINGPANSSSMNDANHPAAQFCEGLTIGGYSDWYMPASNELEVCYYNLKPTTTSNQTFSGANINAVPIRGNYTSGTPAQTSVTDFQTGNTEAFDSQKYWASNESSATSAYLQLFSTGQQAFEGKAFSNYVRAVRRVAV